MDTLLPGVIEGLKDLNTLLPG